MSVSLSHVIEHALTLAPIEIQTHITRSTYREILRVMACSSVQHSSSIKVGQFHSHTQLSQVKSTIGGHVLVDHRQEYFGHELEGNVIREALGIPIAPECQPS